MKTVSVIIPTYNRAQLVCDAINSVLEQDVKDCKLEIIIVDDGSIDETRQIVSSFGEQVRYIYQTNQGVGAARNRGIKEATGEWLAFLDSDDRWLPDKLSLQFNVLDSFPKHRAVYSNFYTSENGSIIIPKGIEYWVQIFSESKTDRVDWREIFSHHYNSIDYGITRSGTSFSIYSGNLLSALLKTICVNCWTMLVHRDCLGENTRFAESPIIEDYWFCCKLSESHDFLFLDCPTVENRAHPGPRESQGKETTLLEGFRKIYEQIYLPSLSQFRPHDDAIKDRLKFVNHQLLKEYLKSAELFKAKALVREMELYKFQDGWAVAFYRIIAAFPFNILSHLVASKRYFMKSKTASLVIQFLSLLILKKAWEEKLLYESDFLYNLNELNDFYQLVCL